MACNVVCISHETGAGGAEVGRLVAERLGFLYVDEEIVVRAAKKSGIDPGKVATQENRQSLVTRVLEAMAEGGSDLPALAGGLPLPGAKESSSERIRMFIREAVLQTAAHGDVVIVAHAASFAVDQRDQNLRVLVAGKPANRAARLATEQGLGDSAAARAVKTADAGRRDYLKRFYDVDQELPVHYDLVVNTDRLGIDGAAQVITDAAGIAHS
jgi:cytidylate kinase